MTSTFRPRKCRIGSCGSEATRDAFLPEALRQDFGHATMWRAVLDFGNPSINRKALLARFDDFIAKYPESEHQARRRKLWRP